MNQELALQLFRYDNGKLYWKINRQFWGNTVGKEAGYIHSAPPNNGYRLVKYNYKQYPIHRIVWIMHYGDIPKGYSIDHKNRNRLDNRIENLRLATAYEQAQNKEVKGYNRDRNRWQATIRRFDKYYHIGCYGTECGARLAYLMEKLNWTLKLTHC